MTYSNPYFIEIVPESFQDLLRHLDCTSEVPENFTVLYRGQNNRNWQLNSTLARPLIPIPPPFRSIVACGEMKSYCERYMPSDELLEYEKQGIDPFYELNKHLQQNPTTKKIKDKPDNRKILTLFIDFSKNPFIAIFFANHQL